MAEGKPLSKEQLFREMASEHLLKSLGVDVQKFLEGPTAAPADIEPEALGKLFGVSIPSQQMKMEPDEDEDEDGFGMPPPPTGLPNPLQMPSLASFKNAPTAPDPTSSKSMKQKTEQLHKKPKKEPSEFQKQVFQKNHESRMNRIQSSQDNHQDEQDEPEPQMFMQRRNPEIQIPYPPLESQANDLVLESLSSSDGEDQPQTKAPARLNQKERMILVPLSAKQAVLTEKQKQMLEDQKVFEQMVECIQKGESQLPIAEQSGPLQDLKEDNDDEAIQFDSSELILIDNEKKNFKIQQIEMDQQIENVNIQNLPDESEKYRKYMSWVPQEEESSKAAEEGQAVKLSKGQKKKQAKKTKEQMKELENPPNLEGAFNMDPFRIVPAQDDREKWLQPVKKAPIGEKTKSEYDPDQWWKVELQQLDEENDKQKKDEIEDVEVEDFADEEAEMM